MPPALPEFDHTDVLAPGFWTQLVSRSAPGIDATCTKIAVDLLGMSVDTQAQVISTALADLRAATNVDAAFLLRLNREGTHIETVHSARQELSPCRFDSLRNVSLSQLPWIASRCDHLRLSEIGDTVNPRTDHKADARRLQALQIGSVLLVAFKMPDGGPSGLLGLAQSLPLGSWDVNLQLLLKLLGSSIASGLERVQTRTMGVFDRERGALIDAAGNDALWDFYMTGNFTEFSPRWKAMMGYDQPGASLPEWQDLVHPDDMPQVQLLMRDYIGGRTKIFESVHRLRHASGEWRWVSSRGKAHMDASGRTLRLLGVEVDITERRLYEEALFREKEAAQITLQAIGDGVITTSADAIIDYINPVAQQMTGWSLDDSVGRHVEDLFKVYHDQTCEPLENPLVASIRRVRGGRSPHPVLMIRTDGKELHIQTSSSPIRDGLGLVTGAVLVFRDVSESRELNRKLTHNASHDAVTGLVNRSEFELRLERALHSARAGEDHYAICFIDLDQFKIINDSCGHAAGDILLAQVGALFKTKVRWRDTLARLGGDEFGVLLEGTSLDEAMRNAEVLRESLRDYRFNYDERTFRITASVGVVPITAENEDVAAVISDADNACAAAKEHGRNRVHSFAENDIELMRRRREMQWATRINSAIEESRFELYRMPILALQQEEHGRHYEMLLRLRDEAGRMVSPDTFMAAAERYGLTPSIDRWVVENVFRWLVSDHDERDALGVVAINLSGQSLADTKFLPFVIEHLERSGLDAKRICFEITETSAIASFAQANRFIGALKQLGCQFSLDDFGTGMSSFGYLKSFPVDYLKIDGSFVRGILSDPIDREMVRSINEIGHLTGKKVIAEYAENAEIINALRDMGVDYAQGYGVAQPSRVSRLELS
jgi:diguanylate cyclase (GGDEF)-like protein/PAS domain S-box-containing protein